MLMNNFRTKSRTLGRKREPWILEKLRNVDCKDHEGLQNSENTEDSEICRSRQEVSKEHMLVNFQLIGF